MEMSKLSSPPQNPDEDTCHIALMSEHTNGQQHSDQQQNPSSRSTLSWTPKSKRWFLSIVAILVFCILVGVCIHFLNATDEGTNYFKESADKEVDCTGDKFNGINITDNQESSNVYYIKYNIAKGRNESVNYRRAQKICRSLDSTLWEVKNKAEWEVIFERSGKNLDLWLGGTFRGKCEKRKPCKDEANKGNGYPVIWNSTGLASDYSRLCECDIGSDDNEQCIYVQQHGNNLWAASNCEEEERYPICIKRNCKVEH